MTGTRLLLVLGAACALAACEARIGKEDRKTDTAASGDSAGGESEAKAEEGQLSIDTPGFQMKLNIPEAMAERANVDSDSGILYPGATLSGMHVEARDRASGRSMVELRFTTGDAPGKVAQWYRDPARASDFSVASANQSGDVIRLSGAEKGDGDPFDLSLRPRSGGGTDGQLRLRDRG
jgi:hypothetical protein